MMNTFLHLMKEVPKYKGELIFPITDRSSLWLKTKNVPKITFTLKDIKI